MFQFPIVIDRDTSATEIDFAAAKNIPQIGQMRRIRLILNHSGFQFHKIADPVFVSDLALTAKMRKRTDAVFTADRRILNHTVFDLDVLADTGIANTISTDQMVGFPDFGMQNLTSAINSVSRFNHRIGTDENTFGIFQIDALSL